MALASMLLTCRWPPPGSSWLAKGIRGNITQLRRGKPVNQLQVTGPPPPQDASGEGIASCSPGNPYERLFIALVWCLCSANALSTGIVNIMLGFSCAMWHKNVPSLFCCCDKKRDVCSTRDDIFLKNTGKPLTSSLVSMWISRKPYDVRHYQGSSYFKCNLPFV